MAVRIATRTLQDSIAQAITSGQQKVTRLQRGLADGKAIHVPSDDPTQASLGMWYRDQIREQAQYTRNLDSAISQLSARDSTVSQIQEVLTQIRVLQTSGSEDSVGSDGRAALSQQVSQLLESLVDLGNTQFAGTYVFGGRRSTEPALVAQRDATGRIVSVGFNPKGVSGAWTRAAAEDVSLTLQANATDLFGKDANLFRQIEALRDALASGDGDKIRSLGDPLDKAQAVVDLAATAIGALVNRASGMKEAASQASTLYEGGRSQAEDLDTAKAMVDYQASQTALQAALESGSQILKMSLLNYLS